MLFREAGKIISRLRRRDSSLTHTAAAEPRGSKLPTGKAKLFRKWTGEEPSNGVDMDIDLTLVFRLLRLRHRRLAFIQSWQSPMKNYMLLLPTSLNHVNFF